MGSIARTRDVQLLESPLSLWLSAWQTTSQHQMDYLVLAGLDP
jgi:hypothetical protein